MVYNPYTQDEEIDPITGQRRSRAQLAFGLSPGFGAPPQPDPFSIAPRPESGFLKSLSDARETSLSPMSGAYGGFANRIQTGPFSLDDAPIKPAKNPVKPDRPFSAPKPDAQPPMTQQQQYEAAMAGYGAMKPAQPGQDYKMATAGYNAIKGDAAQPQQQYNDAMAGYSAMKGAAAQPRPDRDWLQSLGDGIGDAVTNVGQYVQDTPNLLQLGINMMAAANAPSKAEQWEQFAGSFDKFGQANRLDEDRKLSKQDREREIERQKKADAQTAEMHTRQIGSLDREAKDAQRVEQEREATKQVVTGMLKELPADANPVMRNLLEFASIGGNYVPVLEYQIRAAEKAGDREHAEQLARLQGNISLQVARMQADREDKRQDNQFNKVLAGEEAKSAGASGLKMPELEDGLKNIEDALALLEKGRGTKTGSVFDPNMTLKYTFGDKQGGDLLAALNSNTATRTLQILAAQAGVASESDAQRAGWAAVDPTTMSFDVARERLLKLRDYTLEDMARTEAQRVWRRDVGPVFSAFMTLPGGRQVSFDQHFRETYKPQPYASGPGGDSLKFTKDQLGATPNARITAAIRGLQGAPSPEAWDSAYAALSNLPPDELTKAVLAAPRTRVSYADDTRRGDSGLVYGAN